MNLEAQTFEWSDTEVMVTLSSERDPEHCDVVLRMVHDDSGNVSVEVVDILGDGHGVTEWIASNEDVLVSQYARRLCREYPGERRVAWTALWN